MGDATHECGSARMGNDPKTSVLNQFCQSHDVKNLFVTDGSCFVSLPGTHGITTWIMALSWRASEYLADQMKRGESDEMLLFEGLPSATATFGVNVVAVKP